MLKLNSSLGLVMWRAVWAERPSAASKAMHRRCFMKAPSLQELAEPLHFLIVTMHHIPRRPSAMIVARITDEFGGHVALLQRGVHLLVLFDGHAHIGFAVHEQRRRLHVGRVRDGR